MSLYRTIPTTFWEDTKVVDDFTPEDKYFMLYCLTNSHTNLCGCYEISLKQISVETGYNKETIEKLLKRFEVVHKVIFYDFENKELFINNWSKYNWTKSSKLDKPLLNEIEDIKNSNFKIKLVEKYNKRDTVSIPYTYGMDTTVTVTVTDSVTDSVANIYEFVEKNYGRTMSTYEYEQINLWIKAFGEEMVKYAFEISIKNNIKTIKYVEGIINNWRTAQCKTLDDVKKNESNKSKKTPDWFNKEVKVSDNCQMEEMEKMMEEFTEKIR